MSASLVGSEMCIRDRSPPQCRSGCRRCSATASQKQGSDVWRLPVAERAIWPVGRDGTSLLRGSSGRAIVPTHAAVAAPAIAALPSPVACFPSQVCAFSGLTGFFPQDQGSFLVLDTCGAGSVITRRPSSALQTPRSATLALSPGSLGRFPGPWQRRPELPESSERPKSPGQPTAGPDATLLILTPEPPGTFASQSDHSGPPLLSSGA
eukprot:13461903-Alexandrium_andersonii.AAC.1